MLDGGRSDDGWSIDGGSGRGSRPCARGSCTAASGRMTGSTGRASPSRPGIGSSWWPRPGTSPCSPCSMAPARSSPLTGIPPNSTSSSSSLPPCGPWTGRRSGRCSPRAARRATRLVWPVARGAARHRAGATGTVMSACSTWVCSASRGSSSASSSSVRSSVRSWAGGTSPGLLEAPDARTQGQLYARRSARRLWNPVTRRAIRWSGLLALLTMNREQWRLIVADRFLDGFEERVAGLLDRELIRENPFWCRVLTGRPCRPVARGRVPGAGGIRTTPGAAPGDPTAARPARDDAPGRTRRQPRRDRSPRRPGLAAAGGSA